MMRADISAGAKTEGASVRLGWPMSDLGPLRLPGASPDRSGLPSGCDDLLLAALEARAREIHARSDFDACFAGYANGVSDRLASDPLRPLLGGQAGRFALVCLLIALSTARREGLDPIGATPERLGRLLSRHGFASTGRVYALIALWRKAGAVEADAPTADRRHHPLRPGRPLMAHAAGWARATVHATERAVVLPAPAERLLAEPRFVEHLFLHLVAPSAGGRFLLTARFPDVALLMRHAGGYGLLIAIARCVAGAAPGELASARLSARLGMSRAQARKLIALAIRRALLVQMPDGRHPTVRFAAETRDWIALEMAWIADLAEKAARSIGLGNIPAPAADGRAPIP